MQTCAQQLRRLEQICGNDVGRGIQSLVNFTKGNLYRAAESIAHHPHPSVAICTGFYIPHGQLPAAETDGPLGAIQLAAGLAENDIPVQLMTDTYCRGALHAAKLGARCQNLPTVEIVDEVGALNVSHFISIERAGPALDGSIYNMRGQDISAFTPDISKLYSSDRWTKIAIGDGGNEIGMGSIPHQLISQHISQGDKIACRVRADHLIVSGVSNWGAWALLAALAIFKPEWKSNLQKYLSTEVAKRILMHCVHDGPAVDGVNLNQSLTVDGLVWSIHEDVLNQINSILI